MNRTIHTDMKAFCEVGAEGSVLHGMLIGGTNVNTLMLKVPKVVNEWIEIFMVVLLSILPTV